MTFAGLMVCLAWPLTAVSAEEPVDYSRDVRPLLAKHCYACHGPDAEQREAGLRLDQSESALSELDSGSIAVVPRSVEQSELLVRLRSSGDDRMPPAEIGEGLSETEIQKIEAWIEQGASWPRHFAFEPLQLSNLQLKSGESGRHPIDDFLQSKRDSKGIPAPPVSDRRTLIRRLYLDLLGLPPTQEEVEQFLADRHPAAWERLVDRVLASPLYGQRWGRHWLDVARYGDSNGGDENHAYPLAFHYRDFVISALNHDLRYDDFVKWQLAGDLATDHSESPLASEAVVATGFLALGTKFWPRRIR